MKTETKSKLKAVLRDRLVVVGWSGGGGVKEGGERKYKRQHDINYKQGIKVMNSVIGITGRDKETK